MSEIYSNAAQLILNAAQLTGVSLTVPEQLNDDMPLQVTVIGQPQQNLFGALRELHGGMDALDRAFFRGYHCLLSSGEMERVTVIHGEERTETTGAGLADILSQLNSSGAPVICEVELPNSAFQKCHIRVIASSNDFEELDWTDILTHTDYCFVALTSTALLSMCERKVLRKWLLPEMKGALGILLTNDNLILDEDRADIQASLDKFFQGSVPFFPVPAEDSGALAQIMAELPTQVAKLRALRRARTASLLLRCAKEAVELQSEILSSDSEQLEEAIELMKEKAKALPARQESACRRARMQYTSRMKVDASERIASFHQRITEKLRSEINQGENIQEMQNILPRYISDQWNAEAERIMEDIKCSVQEMQRDLTRYVEKDIRDYIASGADGRIADYVFHLTDLYSAANFQADESAFRFEEEKDNSKLKKYGVIASGVALVLMAHPFIGAGLALYGAKKFQKAEQAKVLSSNREALIASAEEMCRDTYDEMVVWMDGIIASVETNLNACVQECYQRIMDAMTQALNNRKHDQSDHADQLSALTALKADIDAAIAQ